MQEIHKLQIAKTAKICQNLMKIFHRGTNNEFIRGFQQFVSPIFPMNFSQFEPLKKKTNFLLVKDSFSQCSSWKRHHNNYSLKKFVDSDFRFLKELQSVFFCVKINSFSNIFGLNRKILPCFKRKQEKNSWFRRFVIRENMSRTCYSTLFILVKSALDFLSWFFDLLSV